ncbi:MAG: 4-hydroxythreonine-4-phosphate dehydrogenase PdxA [Paludibacteraceae bacterium]|nr:4-hydroxythreonine-4-phosphate dehydrogenase PdxA [Paludibacteraceae bacterium]
MEKIKIGITHGDMNGSSYEVILKALEDNRLLDTCIPIVYGSPKAAAYHRKLLELNGNLNLINQAGDASDKRPNIINCCSNETKVELGQTSETAGQAAFDALERATQDLKEGSIGALVTMPVQDKIMPSDRFFGQTVYMEQSFGQKGDALDMLIGPRIRIAFAANDASLSKALGSLTPEHLTRKLEVLHQTLKQDFGLRKPRIALLAFNANAQGQEEENLLRPAVSQAVNQGMVVVGPLAADQLFSADGEFLKYDAVMALYHDQAASVFNLLSDNEGVEYTAGLPVVTTAPVIRLDYTTAQHGQPDENSFRQAIYLAVDIANRRLN